MQAEGFYKARFVRWGISKSSKGTYQWVGEAKVSQYAGEDDPKGNYVPVPKEFRRSVFLYLSPACRGRSLQDLYAIGLPADADKSKLVEYIDQGHELSVDFGKEDVVLQCTHEEFSPPGSNKAIDREKWSVCRRKNFEAASKEDLAQLNSLLEEEATAQGNLPT